MKQTSLEKYGVENYSQTQEFKEKFKQTCLERYGVSHPITNEVITRNHKIDPAKCGLSAIKHPNSSMEM